MEPKELQLLQRQKYKVKFSYNQFHTFKGTYIFLNVFLDFECKVRKNHVILSAGFVLPNLLTGILVLHIMSLIKFRVHGNCYSSAKLVKEYVYTMKEFW